MGKAFPQIARITLILNKEQRGEQDTTPILTVAGWKANFQACATHAKNSPLPLHFVALERIAKTHWEHIESKAEHGFNLVSYCVNFVNDRKCKYALRQVFPAIPTRGFKKWQEVTLHAVAAHHTANSLRSAAETHVILKKLTSGYLAVAHENSGDAESYLSREDVLALEKVAAIVEQVRDRNDLFEVGNVHWQTLVARTRDRARQRVLEKIGWKIHRVWSTNWWHFEQQEKEGIIAAINAVRCNGKI